MATKKEKNKVKEKVLEREYTINLRDKVSVVPRYKRTPKAIKTIKEFLARHMGVKDRDPNLIRIDKYLNEQLWSRGIKNPPMKIKVKAIKDSEGIVRVELSEYPEALKFKKLREEKMNRVASEKAPKNGVLSPKEPTMVEKGKDDKDKDGVDDKKETQEKEKANVEATQQIEKAIAKEMKHEAKMPRENQKGHSKGKQGH